MELRSSKKLFFMVITFLFVCICCFSVITKRNTSNAAVLNETKKVLIKGQTFKLKAYITLGKTTWKSTKKSVATVNQKGKVKAKKKGTAKIIARNRTGNVSCKIIVQEPKLNKANLSLHPNESYKLKVKGTNQSVTWKSSDSNIAKIYEGKVYALNIGTATITAKVLNKKYKCTVTVTEDTSPGSRLNPLSAYQSYTTDVYSGASYLGQFTIELLDYKDGNNALEYVWKHSNDYPSSLQEYIYVKFRLFYSESSGGGLVSATDIINHYTNFFDFSGTCQVDNVSWAYSFESVDDMSDVNLYPGGSSVCSKAILVNRGNTPITYCVQTGYNESTYSPIYTWFSTGK